MESAIWESNKLNIELQERAGLMPHGWCLSMYKKYSGLFRVRINFKIKHSKLILQVNLFIFILFLTGRFTKMKWTKSDLKSFQFLDHFKQTYSVPTESTPKNFFQRTMIFKNYRVERTHDNSSPQPTSYTV